jgi:acetyl-CoA carboxylase carboxyl transferase subunit beta
MNGFTCPHCETETPEGAFRKALCVCNYCGYHSRISWQDRVLWTADEGTFSETDAALVGGNPIGYPGYEEKIAALQKQCGTGESVVTGRCAIEGFPALVGIMDSRFMMGSMGSAAGEKIARLFERGAEEKLPVVMFAASGGARMQEGIVSLMQMAKTAGAAGRLAEAGCLYITVLTDPTTGGVTASFASLGDIIIAEPGILAGFAGKRVTRDAINGADIPADFQSAEFIFRHGFADLIVERKEMRKTLARIFRMHARSANGAD